MKDMQNLRLQGGLVAFNFGGQLKWNAYQAPGSKFSAQNSDNPGFSASFVSFCLQAEIDGNQTKGFPKGFQFMQVELTMRQCIKSDRSLIKNKTLNVGIRTC